MSGRPIVRGAGTDRRPVGRGLLSTLLGVAQNVALPIGCYLALTAVGWSPVWALAGSAGVSVLALGLDRVRGRPLNALGVLVLVRFTLSLTLAWVTGDARVLLVKDSAITLMIAALAAWSLRWERPLIERVRRDLAPDPGRFDDDLAGSAGLRRAHRGLTAVWVAGLTAEATTSIAIALLLPITPAVVITNLTGPAAIVGLVVWTEWRARRVPGVVPREA